MPDLNIAPILRLYCIGYCTYMFRLCCIAVIFRVLIRCIINIYLIYLFHIASILQKNYFTFPVYIKHLLHIAGTHCIYIVILHLNIQYIYTSNGSAETYCMYIASTLLTVLRLSMAHRGSHALMNWWSLSDGQQLIWLVVWCDVGGGVSGVRAGVEWRCGRWYELEWWWWCGAVSNI